MAECFSVKDAEDLNYFLGLEAHRTSNGLHLSQRKYILDLLHRYNMINAKPVTTPMASSPKLTLTSGTSLSEPTEYRKVVGSLQYLAFTRLDIVYAVNWLSQFMHRPTEYHLQAAKRILRYLAGTPTHRIFSRQITNSLSMHTRLRTGLEIQMTMSPQTNISSTLEAIPFSGQPRNRKE